VQSDPIGLAGLLRRDQSARYGSGVPSRLSAGNRAVNALTMANNQVGSQELNLYAYVGNNPVKYYDLFGLDRWGDDKSQSPQAASPAEQKYDPRSPSCYQTCMAQELPQCSIAPLICVPCALAAATGPGVAVCTVGCSCTVYALCHEMVEDRCRYACNE
jgi:hypothetical protein